MRDDAEIRVQTVAPPALWIGFVVGLALAAPLWVLILWAFL